MRKRPLFLCACVFLTGLAYKRYDAAQGLIGVLVLWCIYEMYRGIRAGYLNRRFNRKVRSSRFGWLTVGCRIGVLLTVFLLGYYRMGAEETFRAKYLSKIYDGAVGTVWGEIIKVEHTAYGSVRLILSDTYVRIKEETIACNDVMVYPSGDQFQVGEIHKFMGQIKMFEDRRNEGGFDSRSYYYSQKIDFCLEAVEEVHLQKNQNAVKRYILGLKTSLMQVYDSCCNARLSGFLKGMLLGDKSDLDEDLKALFTGGGIAHILAVSGLHVSVVGRGFYTRLRKCGISFRIAGGAGTLLLLAYCFMVGSGMSAVRAVIMMILYFLAQMKGRSYDMFNALGFAILALLWDNPYLMEYSGFWLSVTALLGVGYVGPALAELAKGPLLRSFWVSVGTSMATLPIVAYCYYEIPLYAPLVNFLLLPILSPMFILALFGGLLGLIFPALSVWMLLPCEWGLALYEWVCTRVEQFPCASVITGIVPMKMMLLFYLLLLAGAWSVMRMVQCEQENKKTKHYRAKVVCVFCLGVCLCCVIYPKAHPEEITFLDVGQGDGIYISDGAGIHFFIDGGSSDEAELGQYTILPFLKYHDVACIDYWFVSHADTDHISGLVEVLESGYEVRYLVIAEAAPEDDALRRLLSLAREAGAEILRMKPGDNVKTGKISVKCLYPYTDIDITEPELSKDRNQSSLVLLLESDCFVGQRDFRALFVGDISTEVEQLLIESVAVSASGDVTEINTGVPEGTVTGLPQVDLYKVSHHGSKYASGEVFLEVIQPKISIISAGRDNSYGHPHPSVLERLTKVGSLIYCTAEQGQVTIRKEE